MAQVPGALAHGWSRTHPFDQRYGTDTSGTVDIDEVSDSPEIRAHGVLYAGSQPSIVRRALAMLPPVTGATFVDIGCGKGRTVLVAAEFPFGRLVGVDASAALVATARRNLDIVRTHRPIDVPIEFVQADATTWPLPDGDLVVYLYHPFDDVLMARFVDTLERAIDAAARSVHVIYLNPVVGRRLDASARLHRVFAGTIAYGDDELGFGPDTDDLVVIWAGGTVRPVTRAVDGRPIVVDAHSHRAHLGPAS